MNRLAITTSSCVVALVAALVFASPASADSIVVAPKTANPNGWKGRSINLTARAGEKLRVTIAFKGTVAPTVGDNAVIASKEGAIADCTVTITQIRKSRAYAVSTCTMEQAKQHPYVYEAL